MRRRIAALLACLLLGSAASAEIYTFRYDEPPEELVNDAMAVPENETTVTLSFVGDCTLGGESGSSGKAFAATIAENGMAYPFANLQPLLATDDWSIANLEGVLSDDRSDKVKKRFNFIGSPAFTGILTEGSIECVTLANNHALDYGERGKTDTISALEDAGIAYFDDRYVTVLEKDGVRIGLTGSEFSPNQEQWLKQAEALRSVGCSAIIHTMHHGEEYADTLTSGQKRTAAFLAENGATLVVGHHPHVVQGMEVIGKTPVVYSLGNCVFGGNTRPRDYDACLLRAELTFRSGECASVQLTLWPIRISGTKNRNDWQPVLLSGEDAARVLEKMQKTSAQTLSPFAEGEGAVQPRIDLQ